MSVLKKISNTDSVIKLFLICTAYYLFLNTDLFHYKNNKFLNPDYDYIIQIEKNNSFPITHLFNEDNINQNTLPLSLRNTKFVNGKRYHLSHSGRLDKTTDMPANHKLSLGLKISINAATQQDLTALPGIGAETAKKIMEYRINNGRFTNINELQRIEGIGPYRFKKIEPHVSL